MDEVHLSVVAAAIIAGRARVMGHGRMKQRIAHFTALICQTLLPQASIGFAFIFSPWGVSFETLVQIFRLLACLPGSALIWIRGHFMRLVIHNRKFHSERFVNSTEWSKSLWTLAASHRL